MVRTTIQHAAERRLRSNVADLSPADLERPAIVLAPHPDDETLGCGGLIASKRAIGVDVTVAFLTDGAGSHHHPDGRAELAARRRVEAQAACRILGVADERVVFVGIPDGALGDRVDEAVVAVTDLVRSSAASQIIIPHPDEPPSDHRTVRSIVDQSLWRAGHDAQLLMFPVWLWDQWPWTNPLTPPRRRHSRRQVASIALRDRFGTRLLSMLTHCHDITAVLDVKRRALAAHETQTLRQHDDPTWLTLGDVARGEWLDRLFQPVEYYTMATAGPTSRTR
jgi:LmbE family N-acetylglucosaminyl deacetylase